MCGLCIICVGGLPVFVGYCLLYMVGCMLCCAWSVLCCVASLWFGWFDWCSVFLCFGCGWWFWFIVVYLFVACLVGLRLFAVDWLFGADLFVFVLNVAGC